MKRTARGLFVVFAVILALPTRVNGYGSAPPDDGSAVAFQVDATHDGTGVPTELHLPLHTIWSIDFGQQVSYPLIADGRAFVVAGNQLVGLDPHTGQTLWSQLPENRFGWVPGAAFADHKVIVVTAEAQSGAAIFAFNDRTGNQAWAQSLPYQTFFSAPPTALDGVVYTSGTGTGGTVYAIRTSDGRLLWMQNVFGGDESSTVCVGGNAATPVLHQDLLYVEGSYINSHSGAIFNATTGAVTGFFDAVATPAFADGMAFLNQSERLVAVDAATGAVRWTIALPKGESFGPPPLAAPSLDCVFEATSSGALVAYRMQNGKTLMSVPLGANAGSSGMAMSGDVLLVPAGTHLVAFRG